MNEYIVLVVEPNQRIYTNRFDFTGICRDERRMTDLQVETTNVLVLIPLVYF